MWTKLETSLRPAGSAGGGASVPGGNGPGARRGHRLCEPRGRFLAGGTRRDAVALLLVPFPTAADNHQFFNARSFEQTGAAHCSSNGTPRRKKWRGRCGELVEDGEARDRNESRAGWLACAPGGGDKLRNDFANRHATSGSSDPQPADRPNGRERRSGNVTPVQSSIVA